jgi:hypothetical protein
MPMAKLHKPKTKTERDTNMSKSKYTINIQGQRVPVRKIAAVDYLGESFFLHVHKSQNDMIGITHTETGLSAGKVSRFNYYVQINQGRQAYKYTKDELIDAALRHLARIPERNFRLAMDRARMSAEQQEKQRRYQERLAAYTAQQNRSA